GASAAPELVGPAVGVDRRAAGGRAAPLPGDAPAATRPAAGLDLYQGDVAAGAHVHLAAAGVDAIPEERDLLRLGEVAPHCGEERPAAPVREAAGDIDRPVHHDVLVGVDLDVSAVPAALGAGAGRGPVDVPEHSGRAACGDGDRAAAAREPAAVHIDVLPDDHIARRDQIQLAAIELAAGQIDGPRDVDLPALRN